MSDLVMRTAIGTYGFTEDLKNGTTTSSKFEMDHVEISPITSVFRRMVREMEFDVAEMALFHLSLRPGPRQGNDRDSDFCGAQLLSWHHHLQQEVRNQGTRRPGWEEGRSAWLHGNSGRVGPGTLAVGLRPGPGLGDLGFVGG